MFSIPGLKVISLTDAAATRIREIMAQSAGEANPPALGLRVGVKKGGCAGMEYTFEVAHEAGKGDEVVTAGGVLGRISKISDLYLTIEISNGVEMTVQKSSVTMVLPKGTLKAL